MQNYVNGPKRLVLVALVFAVGILPVISCSPKGYSGKMETLIVAIPHNEINALLYIAESQNFFGSNGLQVTLKENYDSGATATAGMLKGEAEISAATDFLMARQILDKTSLATFACIDKYETTYVMWRTDSGFKTIQNLRGKRIGVPLQTIGEFYLGRTLELNGINLSQVTLVDVRSTDSEKALVNKEVDAVVTWEPFVTSINEHLAEDVFALPIQSGQLAYWNLVSSPEWINSHAEIIKRLVMSLTQAENYMSSHEKEAKNTLQKRMNWIDTQIPGIWTRNQFSVSLDQPLILAMEDEARWMISNNLTTEKTVPNFLDYIYEEALKAVKPEAVKIIR
jgi:NitT/TauT family transport system substrate-binding protein